MRKTLVSLVLACCLTLFTALASCALAAPSAPPSPYSNRYTENGVTHNDAVVAITTSGKMDFYTWTGSTWGSTSYSNAGYDLYYQTSDGSKQIISNSSTQVGHPYPISGYNGATITMTPEIRFGGQFVRVTFTVNNQSNRDMYISFGSGADVQIDGDDRANISQNSYGFQMHSSSTGRNFYFFGFNTPTVDPVDFWWVGQYHQRENHYYYDARSSEPSPQHSTSGVDSEMVYTWNKVHVPAGQTVTRSVLFGVGDPNFIEQYLPVEVKFDSRGGTQIPSAAVVKGNKVPKPSPNPTRDGYEFAGWYKDASCRNPFNFNTTINAAMTLYAKWNYVVSFGGGDDGLPNHQITVDPDNPRLPDTLPVPPSKDDEEFQGWFSDPECTKPVKPGDPIDCPSHFYPKWTPKYTISFDAPGCKPIPPQCIVQGHTCPQPENPVRDGYHFDGWYTDKECTNKFDFSTPITCPIELHAKLDYVVSFGDGTDGLTDYQIIVDSNNANLPGTLPVPPERENEEFQGWYYDPECTKPVKPGDSISGPTVLYPNWPSRHTVVFDTNGGTPIPPVKVTDGNLLPMPAEPAKPNNTFGGWSYIDPGCNCKKPFDPSKPITEGITIIVDWLPHIDFSTDPENPLPPVVVPPDGHIDLPTPPSKPDSSFAGWFEDPEFTKPFDPTKPIDGPITLYPKYAALPKTGDNTPLFLLIAALVISGTAFAFAARKKHA